MQTLPSFTSEALAAPSPHSRRRLPRWYAAAMSVAQQPQQPELRVLPPEEALRQARPVPPADDLVIEGLTAEEWEALRAALADR